MAIQSYSGNVVITSNGHKLTIYFAGGSVDDISKLGSKVGAAIDKELREMCLNEAQVAEHKRLSEELAELIASKL
jgi:hypothetical protein